MSENRNERRRLQGVVTSDKMAQTILVEVERRYKHPQYGKYLLSRKRYMAHDINEDARVGDRVEIVGTRPLSKMKRWRLAEILRRAPVLEETATSSDGGES